MDIGVWAMKVIFHVNRKNSNLLSALAADMGALASSLVLGFCFWFFFLSNLFLSQ